MVLLVKKINKFDKLDLVEQARLARDTEWEADLEVIELKLQEGIITDSEYCSWLADNPRPSDAVQDQTKERTRLKRKSKKHTRARIEIVDHAALREVELRETTIEWSSDFDEGSLVETRDGDVGMVMEQHDPSHNRVTKPKHIKYTMLNSYVRLLVNGNVEWHTKVSVSSLADD
jgi:hypothetical protein